MINLKFEEPFDWSINIRPELIKLRSKYWNCDNTHFLLDAGNDINNVIRTINSLFLKYNIPSLNLGEEQFVNLKDQINTILEDIYAKIVFYELQF